MQDIPFFKIEEHHEAFLVWHDAIKKKFLPQNGNALLHVDQHSDLATPVLRTSINELKLEREVLQSFTYNELGIGNYILPAVFTGIFNTVYWMLQLDPVSQIKPTQEFILSTYKNEGKIFMINKKNSSDRKGIPFKRRDFTVNESLRHTQPIVLDIDIDYFSCNVYQNQLIRLEITQDQFERFNNNKYHLMRFEYSCYSEQVDDQYFMVFNQSEDIVIRPSAKVSKNQILQRIDDFMEWLSKNHINPNIIEVCRNTFSEYTPKDQREFIEEKLESRIATLYNLQETSFE